MIVECTYPYAEVNCIYPSDGHFNGHFWKKGDICIHRKPHLYDMNYCGNGGKCSCEYTFKCQMLEVLNEGNLS